MEVKLEPTTNTRDARFDILRGIGILYMVMGHTGFGEAFSHYIHGFHMPLFFLCSGYFFDRKKPFGAMIKKDIRTLMLPYTAFFLLCQVLHFVYTKDFSWKYSVLSYFTSNHNRIDVAGGYWFLMCLFTAKVLFWCVCALKSDWMKFVAVAAMAAVGMPFNNQIPVVLPLCLDSALVAMPFLFAGYLLREYKDSKVGSVVTQFPAWLLLPGIVLNCMLLLINGEVNLRANHHGNLVLFWLNALTALLLYLRLSAIIANARWKPAKAVGGMLAYCGKNSMTFLVFNELAIFAFGLVLQAVGVSNRYYIRDVVVLVGTMASLSVGAVVLSKTRLRFLIGK